jgi:hypothetical protein
VSRRAAPVRGVLVAAEQMRAASAASLTVEALARHVSQRVGRPLPPR